MCTLFTSIGSSLLPFLPPPSVTSPAHLSPSHRTIPLMRLKPQSNLAPMTTFFTATIQVPTSPSSLMPFSSSPTLLPLPHPISSSLCVLSLLLSPLPPFSCPYFSLFHAGPYWQKQYTSVYDCKDRFVASLSWEQARDCGFQDVGNKTFVQTITVVSDVDFSLTANLSSKLLKIPFFLTYVLLPPCLFSVASLPTSFFGWQYSLLPN